MKIKVVNEIVFCFRFSKCRPSLESKDRLYKDLKNKMIFYLEVAQKQITSLSLGTIV